MSLVRCGVTLAAIALSATAANAAPLLQLDIAGGQYDPRSRTIVATANPFTLYAILTPKERDAIEKRLDKTYYVSAAISPTVSPDGKDLGSFLFNGLEVNATGDMVYGKPPMELFGDLQGHDSGDLAGHTGIYPTFFTEFAFQFSSLSRISTYDSATDRSGPGADENGGSYIAEFTVDTTLLHPNFVIHFDLYNAKARECGVTEGTLVDDPGCLDVDIASYAPFTHDAQSPPVPEPASMLLLGSGLAAGIIRRYRGRERV